MNAGDLTERLAFGVRADASDDFGGTEGAFAESFQRSARIVTKFGGEQVFAARQTGVQPVTITVRADPQTKTIKPNWRAVVVSGEAWPVGTVFDLQSVGDPYSGRPAAGQWIEILAQAGTGQA